MHVSPTEIILSRISQSWANTPREQNSRITPACTHLNWTQTGLSVLHMIDSPCGVFDSKLEQHKSVEESQLEKNSFVSTRGKCASNLYQK